MDGMGIGDAVAAGAKAPPSAVARKLSFRATSMSVLVRRSNPTRMSAQSLHTA